MKKITFSLVLVLMSFMGFSQDYFSIDFSGGNIPPTGWTIDEHAANWLVSSTNKAGGNSPEAKLYYYPAFNGTSRMISPVVDLTGVSNLIFSFKHMLDDYNGSQGYSLKVVTTSDGGTTWNEVWAVSPSGDIPAENQNLTITNGDVGSATFQVAFVFEGNSYNIDNWYIDDLHLFSPYSLDAAMAKLTNPTIIKEPTAITGNFENLGMTTIESFDINWQTNGGDIHTTSYTGQSIEPLAPFDFSCTDLFYDAIGTYNLDVWISNVNGQADDNPSNDTLTAVLYIPSLFVPQKPVFEEFTSCTCGPCASFHTSFVPWCQSHEDDITLVKYQMSWPGNGDPYYTEEGGVRRGYYGVSWVPWLDLNGEHLATNMTEVNTKYDEAITLNTIYKIASEFSMNGSEITIHANVLPFANQEDVKVVVVAFENETTQNTGSNGETSFEHVMMKMFPDGSGVNQSFQDREPVGFTYTYDMGTTHVEELDDLNVAIIVQKADSRRVLQSAYAQKDATLNDNDKLNSLSYNGTAIPGFDPDVMVYSVELPAGTTTPPTISTGGTQDANATEAIIQTNAANGTATVDVFAENLLTHRQYVVNFSVVGVVENAFADLKLFPNPTSDYLFVSGVVEAELEIISLDGKTVFLNTIKNNEKIDIQNLNDGVYFVKISNEDATTYRKILVK